MLVGRRLKTAVVDRLLTDGRSGVIPCRPGDPGARPLPTNMALYSESIGWTVTNPHAAGGWHDFQLQVSCAVSNLGPIASPAAMIEFYTGTDIAMRHKRHALLTPAEVAAHVQLLGRASFTAPPGATTTVRCPTPWVPGSYKDALQGILVQVRDLFSDPWTAPFDAINDRRVGRNDNTMPLTWNTGVDFNATPLPPGASDQHWELVAGPGIGAPTACGRRRRAAPRRGVLPLDRLDVDLAGRRRVRRRRVPLHVPPTDRPVRARPSIGDHRRCLGRR
jgi:hypothetical protein